MTDNVLTNGGFESDWTTVGSHDCLVIPVDAPAYRAEIDNIFTPPGWLTWFRHDPGTLDQPEVRPVAKSHDPVRVDSGEAAQLFFTFYRRHDGGFMQSVDVAGGGVVRLTASAHAWSNHPLEGHQLCEDDPRCSCGVGNGPFFALASEVPPPTGEDSWADAVPNVTFQLGIDPAGGTDPLAASVVWGAGAHIYNAHAAVPAVEARLVGEQATVFLRSSTLWAFKHNDAYWDSVVLEVTEPGDQGPEIEIGASPEQPVLGAQTTPTVWASEDLPGLALTLQTPSGETRALTLVDQTSDEDGFIWTFETVHVTEVGLHWLALRADEGVTARGSFEVIARKEDLRGMPRVQYERTYVLLFPGAGAEWAEAVVDGSWNRERFTIGASADDAGIGHLDVRLVVAVNPERWESDLESFFATHYPGVIYAPLHAQDPDDLRQKLSQL